MTTPPPKAYCNCLAQERGLDPVGHAGSFDDCLIIETPLPWPNTLYQTAGALPQTLLDLMALWLKDYSAGAGYPHLPLVIAPDPQYSHEGLRRMLFYTRPAGAFARFDKVEYLVPTAEVGALVWSLYQERAALPRFEAYRVPAAEPIRDLLVCTHGTVDAACAKFGFPLYKSLRTHHASDVLRVWRVSHFGGHVFAPTLMDMPTGHYWAYVGQTQAAHIVRRTGAVSALRGHYRGWAGMHVGFEQAAECELWQQHGWSWFDYHKQATSTIDPDGAEVAITYAPADSTREVTANLRVLTSHTVETPHSTNEPDSYDYPQYQIVRVNSTPPTGS